MALKRLFNYRIETASLGSRPIDLETDVHRKLILLRQAGGEDSGTNLINLRFDEINNLIEALTEIRREFVPNPPTGGRD